MPVETGAEAPQFTLMDAGGERMHSLAEALQQGPVLLGIYKCSCEASKTAFLFLEKIYRYYPSERLTVWGIAQDSSNVTRSFMRRTGVTFPVLIDTTDYATSRAYDIAATPSIFLIDQSGAIVWHGMGFQKPAVAELNAKLAEMLDMEPLDILANTEAVKAWVPG